MRLDETPPPPSAALADAIAKMQPVRTRAPLRTLLLMLLAFLAYGSIPLLFIFRTRPDLSYQPIAWLLAIGFAWLMGLVVPLALALVPRSGQVLPDGMRATVAAVSAALGLVAISLLFPSDVPGHSLRIPGLFGHCLEIALGVAALPIAAGLLVARRLSPVGSWRLGAALGAAAGALSGMVLHLICGVTSPLHVAAAHAGGVVVCALAGALIASRVVK